jgi:hypothetical protein
MVEILKAAATKKDASGALWRTLCLETYLPDKRDYNNKVNAISPVRQTVDHYDEMRKRFSEEDPNMASKEVFESILKLLES